MQVQMHRDTPAWQLQVWLSFLMAVFLCGVGLAWLPGQAMAQAFMVMGYVFCLSAAFVLAKFVRDSEQARRSAHTPSRYTPARRRTRARNRPRAHTTHRTRC